MIRWGLIILTLILLGYFMVTQQGFQAVAAGVAIFLFGMMFMEQGFKALTGSTLKRILSKATDNIFKSQLFGFVATALMQSSSLVTVITISTLTAGLIPLAGVSGSSSVPTWARPRGPGSWRGLDSR